jgi:hypothetical protein
MVPAPNPKGTADKHKNTRWFEKVKPSKARAVTEVLIAVTTLVPNLFMSLLLNKLEMTVAKLTRMVTALWEERGKPNSTYMAGQADPNKESGTPKPI